jgi:hypothetical protein
VDTFFEGRRRVMGSLAGNEVRRLNGNLELIFSGILGEAGLACHQPSPHASAVRARTARNPSPASSGEAVER